jgi:hypothetical protein
VTTRGRCAWNKIKELRLFLTAKGVSLSVKGKVYKSCVKSCIDYVKRYTMMEVEGSRPRGRSRKTWMKTLDENTRRYALLPVDAKDKTFIERENPWCEAADLGKSRYTIGALTNGSAIKPTCVCV